jgi:hypothetical protein
MSDAARPLAARLQFQRRGVVRDQYATLAICRTLELARAAFEAAITEKPAGQFMIRNRTRVVWRPPGRRLVSGYHLPVAAARGRIRGNQNRSRW